MKEEQLLKELRKNPFLLAPMAGITDSPFRSFMREMGCGIVTTELVSAKSLQLGNKMSCKLMAFEESQRPVGVQIFGEELSALAEGAKIAEQTGADFIDLNFGCPVPKIVKKGAGSAVLKDLPFIGKILHTVKSAVSIPVSIKVRIGWNEHSRNTPEIARIAHNEGIIWIAVHGRTRAQAFSGRADWNYIKEIKSQSPLPVIGNGDLTEATQIIALKNQSACDGMMIGRGALKNPWLFQEAKAKTPPEKKPSPTPPPAPKTKKRYMDILNRLKQKLEGFYDEKMFLLQYKKFACWYSAGHPLSAHFRQAVFQSKTKQDTLTIIENYFGKVDFENKQDIAYEPALMQGHG